MYSEFLRFQIPNSKFQNHLPESPPRQNPDYLRAKIQIISGQNTDSSPAKIQIHLQPKSRITSGVTLRKAVGLLSAGQ
jgi:hypothetical protein